MRRLDVIALDEAFQHDLPVNDIVVERFHREPLVLAMGAIIDGDDDPAAQTHGGLACVRGLALLLQPLESRGREGGLEHRREVFVLENDLAAEGARAEPMRQLVSQRASPDRIHDEAVARGMTTLIENGVRLAQAGETSLDEVLRILPPEQQRA